MTNASGGESSDTPSDAGVRSGDRSTDGIVSVVVLGPDADADADEDEEEDEEDDEPDVWVLRDGMDAASEAVPRDASDGAPPCAVERASSPTSELSPSSSVRTGRRSDGDGV